MLNFASYMEMLMVICFGISWPINIVKAWKARSTKGISLLFYTFILLGYLFALVGKLVLIFYYAPVYVMFFYVLNTLMVATGVGIYFRNRSLEKQVERYDHRTESCSQRETH